MLLNAAPAKRVPMELYKLAPSFALALFGLIAASTAVSAQSLSVERSLNDTPWGYVKVSEPVRAGSVSQRFELRAGDCGSDSYGSDCDRGNERSEVRSRKEWSPRETMWIGGSVYIGKDFQFNPDTTHILQVKTPGDGITGPNPQPFSLTVADGRFAVTLGWLDDKGNQHLDRVSLGSPSQLKGKWTDFVIGFGPKAGNGIVVYQDGRLVLNEAIRYQKPKRFYLKYGIYRSTSSMVNVLYWDEMRMGRSQDRVEIDESKPVD